MEMYYRVMLKELFVESFKLTQRLNDDFNRVMTIEKIKLNSDGDKVKKFYEISEAYAVARDLKGFVVRVILKDDEKPDIQVIKDYGKGGI